jgi:hypothetical protein
MLADLPLEPLCQPRKAFCAEGLKAPFMLDNYVKWK